MARRPAIAADDEWRGCGAVIDTNTVVLGLLIGAENFDVGHIGFGPSGTAAASPTWAGRHEHEKGGGCTGLQPPTGDFYAIDYVAHEMGHQFDGNHTFNGIRAAAPVATATRAPRSSRAPGTSVMAYAGICGRDNLQPHSDPYFSQRQPDRDHRTTSPARSPTSTRSSRSALANFDGTDSFTLDFTARQTATITNGSNYTAAGIKAAIEAVTGGPPPPSSALSSRRASR